MEINVRGHHVSVPERFRQHAVGKLARLAKLDSKAMRVDVEVSKERNSRQSDRRERVELTIRSKGPLIRAEAAAEDRYTALDMAYAKLEARLRRACDRRKVRNGDNTTVRSPGVLAAMAAAEGPGTFNAAAEGPGTFNTAAEGPGTFNTAAPVGLMEPANTLPALSANGHAEYNGRRAATVTATPEPDGRVVPIQMEGDGPLVVREKEHPARPMTIDQALLEMELVGHDFYLFHDSGCDKFSVVYRRRGYDYGVIRLVEELVEGLSS